ncbi:MAG: multidrug effflux MFS transporter [Pseudomonadota bacterium]
MRPATSPPKLLTLILLTAFSTLTLNMFLPSLASIAVDLKADYALVSLAVGLYLGITAVVQLVVGTLSDRIGRRPVLLGAICLFTVASIACALAQDVWTFLIFRMLQGGMIAGYAMSLAIVRDTNEERKAASLIGYISMSMAVAPMLGPMLGGLLDTFFGWRANFWFYAVSGLVLLAICWVDLGETNDPSRNRDVNRLAETGALLRSRRFWGFALCTAFSTGAFYIFLAGAPLVAMATFGVSTATLGVFVGSITAGFMTGGFIAGRIAQRFEPTTMMIAGRVIACGGLSVGLVLVLAGTVTPLTYFGSTIFVGLGNGITMPSSNAGAVSVRPKLAGTAAGFNGALTVACGAVLTTLAGVLVKGENGAATLLSMMLSASFIGLLAAFWSRSAQRKIIANAA